MAGDGGTYADEDPNAGVVERTANSIRKIVSSLANSAAPKSITQRKQRIDSAVDSADGSHDDDTLSRWRSNQSTDRDNSY
jgi:hypothetical protein